jgi:hypothetical protein
MYPRENSSCNDVIPSCATSPLRGTGRIEMHGYYFYGISIISIIKEAPLSLFEDTPAGPDLLAPKCIRRVHQKY